ncbi:MAG: hypothetical protein A3F11_07335 [Gammaproteobacteria bacterium RIFCSPHIGHO2_12_FULL_37_14]|nr:MAG: hypothetical protein A3F11_07335 [Gammaproteobacteria bacterium RIFCSPHIGHO2_12_FULL_37_14]
MTVKISKNRVNNQEAIIQKRIVIPSFILKFQFPIELWLPVLVTNLHGVSIVSATRDETKVMSKLSQTCRYFYSLYQPELEKRAVKKLLECFFMPTETNVKKAMAMLLANPKLAFVKIENDKTITDMRQRGFEGSLLQAAMQTKAVGWLNWLNKEVIEKTHTQAEAHAQYQEKFGQPDERKARMLVQLDIDLKAIEAAFTWDPCTNEKPTLQTTLDAFAMMRKHFAEENKAGQVIKTGEFFPLEIMEKICEVYCHHLDDYSWSDNQLSCYSRFIIGFAPRVFTADDLLRLLKGFCNKLDEQNPLFGDFKLHIQFNNRQYDLDFTNLEKYPNFRLGFDFFIDTYYGAHMRVLTAGRVLERPVENLVSNKNCKLVELAQQHPTPGRSRCKIV